MSNRKDDNLPLEELDVIEARELKVGNAFHAFRFNAIDFRELDEDTLSLIKEAAESLGLEVEHLQRIAQNEAVEDNAFANFARGILAATKGKYK